MAISSIGKFQVVQPLGNGAHSSILLIRRQEDSKHYALKVVPIEDKEDQKFLDQAELELRVGQMLDHPNLVKVHALEKMKDWLFRVRKAHLLIEYVNGKTLDQVQGLSLPRLVQVFAKIAAGLGHMHRRGVYHADLKPGNIMLSKTGEVKIIDYGLAWIKSEPKGRVQGTPEYMAPEQVKHHVVNEKTDLYNFGATMYRLVTWRLPPNMATAAATPGLSSKQLLSMLTPVQEFAPAAPQPLCDLIHRCLSYKADQRPDRVSEVIDTLNPLLEALVKGPDDELETLQG